MNVIGLDGRNYHWKVKSKVRSNASKPHIRCRELLKQLFPLDQIIEEIYLPGAGKLYLDFYLPLRKLAIEVDGRQHVKYIPHFHGTKLNFFKSLRRDDKKRHWCELNNIILIKLEQDEKDDDWRRKLSGREN